VILKKTCLRTEIDSIPINISVRINSRKHVILMFTCENKKIVLGFLLKKIKLWVGKKKNLEE
jgi:hypothetical protein